MSEKINVFKLPPVAQALLQKQLRSFFIMGMRTAANIVLKHGTKPNYDVGCADCKKEINNWLKAQNVEIANDILKEAEKFRSGNATVPGTSDQSTEGKLRERDSSATP